MKARLFAFVTPVLVLGCSDASGPEDAGLRSSGALTTDAISYRATPIENVWGQPRYAFTVIATYHNQLSAPVYLQRCYPDTPSPIFGVESLDAPRESGYDPAWACVGHDRQIEIAPGATRTDTLTIQGPNGFDGRTHEPLGRVEGRFRLVYEVALERGDGAPLVADAMRTSNVFTVRTDR